jgi:hypothetical protein
MAKLKPSRTPREASPPAPPPLTDLERCQRRWENLWRGVMWTLEAEDPDAYARILLKLERHRLVGDLVAIQDGHEFPLPQGALMQMVPTAEILRASDAFVDDRRPLSLKGRGRGRPPISEIGLYYFAALWHVGQSGPARATRAQESREHRALCLVAKRYGSSVNTARKRVNRARRDIPPDQQRMFRGGGQKLWESFQTI